MQQVQNVKDLQNISHILPAQIVIAGLGTQWPIAVLQVNCCVVEPPGKKPLMQVKVCDVFVLVAAKGVDDPLTAVAMQPN